MGKRERNKGLNEEREVARSFVDAGFPDARRWLEYQDGEAKGVDIKGTFPFAVQCKRGKSYASINKIKEIKLNQGWAHVLTTRADREERMAVLYYDDFMRMVKLLKDNNLI